MPTTALIRAQFPALDRGTVFFDNAGGSQLPGCVIDAAREYMLSSFVQTGADYAASTRATENVRLAHETVKAFLNGGGKEGNRVGQGIGEVILGPSSTALCYTLAGAYAEAAAAGAFAGRNEIIIATFGHEANVGPWARLASRGFTVKHWDIERDSDGTPRPRLETLQSLLSSRTLLVTFPQVSNVLGEVYDAGAITRACHAAGAQAVVDGVAYAPHHAPDMNAIGCDWYVYSTYKVFGPHMAAMFGRREAFELLTGPNHYFIPRENMPYKWELGGSCHEGCAMVNALWPYACFLADAPEKATGGLDHGVFRAAFRTAASIEDGLMRTLMNYLASRKEVTVIGPTTVDERRVCIAAFTHASKSSGEIARTLNAQGLGARYGSFYSRRLCEQLGLDPVDGVVRISMAHYNSPEEMKQVIAALDGVL